MDTVSSWYYSESPKYMYNTLSIYHCHFTYILQGIYQSHHLIRGAFVRLIPIFTLVVDILCAVS